MRDWLDCKLMLRELLRNGPILSHIFHTLIILVIEPEKKLFSGKLSLNFNFLPNTDVI